MPGDWGAALGAGVGLGAKPESAEGPAEEEHRCRDERRLASAFSADRGSAGSLRAWHWLGAGSALCSADAGCETGAAFPP